MVLGQNIRIIRERLGLTQQQFATLLNVTVSTVYKWETDRTDKMIPRKYWNAIKSIRRDSGRSAELKLELLGVVEKASLSELRALIKHAEELMSERDNTPKSSSG